MKFELPIGLSPTRLSHAYIISSADKSASLADARAIAAAMVCSADAESRPCGKCPHCEKMKNDIHPDVITIQKEESEKELKIAPIRDMRADASVVPNEAARKVYIIEDAGNMNNAAQNALLKVLEEPPKHAAFILVCENVGELLPTVRSRCVKIAARAQVQPDENEQARQLVSEFFLAFEKGGDAERLTFFTELEKAKKNDFQTFAEIMRRETVTKLASACSGGYTALSREFLVKILSVIDEILNYLDFNVAIGHAAGLMMAQLL